MVLRDRWIVQEWFCAIGRSCRNCFAQWIDRAGMVLRDRSIVWKWFCAIGRPRARMVLRDWWWSSMDLIETDRHIECHAGLFGMIYRTVPVFLRDRLIML